MEDHVFKTLSAAAIGAALAFAAAAPAAAAQYVVVSGPSGVFGFNSVPSGKFSHTYTFSWPRAGESAATVSSVRMNARTNIDFTSATLNGAPFEIGSKGTLEYRFLNDLPTLAGAQTLVLAGRSGGAGSYSGTLAFSPAAVPEVGSWALMIAGFGVSGFALRRRGLPACA